MMIQKQARMAREVMPRLRKAGCGWKLPSRKKPRMWRKSTCNMRCARRGEMKAMGCGENTSKQYAVNSDQSTSRKCNDALAGCPHLADFCFSHNFLSLGSSASN